MLMNLCCIIFNNEEYCETIGSALSDSGTSLLVFRVIFTVIAHYSIVETIMYVLNSFIYLNIATMYIISQSIIIYIVILGRLGDNPRRFPQQLLL